MSDLGLREGVLEWMRRGSKRPFAWLCRASVEGALLLWGRGYCLHIMYIPFSPVFRLMYPRIYIARFHPFYVGHIRARFHPSLSGWFRSGSWYPLVASLA